MRVFKPESQDQAHCPALATSWAGAALMVIALLGAHTTALIFVLAVSLTAYLLWQVTWIARHRMVPLPRGPAAATDTLEAHVARAGQSEYRFGKPSCKSWGSTI